MATAGRTAPITKQVAITGTETHLGGLFPETTGKVRITVPKAATSSIWLGAKGVTASGANGGGEYPAGTCTQLPTTSLEGWYAISSAPVTITIEMATGGVDTPDWSDAGTAGASSGGGGGGEVTQGAGDAASPWYVSGVNAGVGERLATHALQGAGLPGAFTAGGGVKVGLVDALPTGTNSIGGVTNAVASQADGHSATIGATTDADTANTLIGRIKNLLSRIPAALVGGRFDTNIGSWFGSTEPTVGQKVAASSVPVVWANDTALPAGANWVGRVRIGDGTNEPVFTNSAPVGSEYGMGVRIISMPNVTVTGTSAFNLTQVGGAAVALGQTTMAASIPVTFASNQSALSVDTELPPAAALGDALAANTTTVFVGAGAFIRDGSSWARWQGTTAGGAFVQGPTANSSAVSGNPVRVAGADGQGTGNVRTLSTTTTGELYVQSPTDAPIANATTNVWPRVPAGSDKSVPTSGVIIMKGTGGRYLWIKAELTSATPVYIAVHNAATATTPTAANVLDGPYYLEQYELWPFEEKAAEPFTAGCKVVAWTDREMTTIATTATFTAFGRVA